MINQLTHQQFTDTMGAGMTDVTGKAEAVADIWEYAEVLVKEGIVSGYVWEHALVERVYRDGNSWYDHILLPPKDNESLFVIIVVDIRKEEIIGHVLLDIEKEYGLT